MKSQKKEKTLTAGIYKSEREEMASSTGREPQRRRGREQGSQAGRPGRSWRAHHCRVELTPAAQGCSSPAHMGFDPRPVCVRSCSPATATRSRGDHCPKQCRSQECHRPPTGTVKLAERGGEQEHSVPVRVLINDCCAKVNSSWFLLTWNNPSLYPMRDAEIQMAVSPDRVKYMADGDGRGCHASSRGGEMNWGWV